MEQITKLTVGLGIRLNRVDKMLESKRRTNEKVRIYLTPISDNNFKSLNPCQDLLQSKRSKLKEQISEANSLQSNTERRGKNIRAIVQRRLDQESVEVLKKKESSCSSFFYFETLCVWDIIVLVPRVDNSSFETF